MQKQLCYSIMCKPPSHSNVKPIVDRPAYLCTCSQHPFTQRTTNSGLEIVCTFAKWNYADERDFVNRVSAMTTDRFRWNISMLGVTQHGSAMATANALAIANAFDTSCMHLRQNTLLWCVYTNLATKISRGQWLIITY